jgi:hypothetical protein
VPEPENHYDRSAIKAQRRTGQVVGRVPRDLAAVLGNMLRQRAVHHIYVVYTGVMQHDGPILGGGPKLVCAYLLETERASIHEVAAALRPIIDNDNLFL